MSPALRALVARLYPDGDGRLHEEGDAVLLIVDPGFLPVDVALAGLDELNHWLTAHAGPGMPVLARWSV